MKTNIIFDKDLKKQTHGGTMRNIKKERNSLRVLTRTLQNVFEKDLIKNLKITLKPSGDMPVN